MPSDIDLQEVRARLALAIEELDRGELAVTREHAGWVLRQLGGVAPPVVSGLGQCRLDPFNPTAAIQPVFDDFGFAWECFHPVPHRIVVWSPTTQTARQALGASLENLKGFPPNGAWHG